MKKFLIFMMLSMLVVGISGCANEPKDNSEALEPITIVLDWTPNTNHTGLYVALAKGYYEEAGLDVKIEEPPEDGAAMLTASGKAQFGIDFQESLAAALTSEEPLPVTAVAAVIAHNTSGILSLKSSDIQSFGDMQGKTYAAYQMPFEEALLSQVIHDDGGDYSKVNIVPNAAYDVITAFQSGIDAIWVYEGWEMMAAELAGLDYSYLSFREADPVFDFYTPVIIANNDYLTEHPENSRRFIQATQKGYAFAIENPEEAANILVEAIPELDLELVKAGQIYLADLYQAESSVWGYIDETRWENFYQWMFEQELIDKPLGKQGFTNEYVMP